MSSFENPLDAGNDEVRREVPIPSSPDDRQESPPPETPPPRQAQEVTAAPHVNSELPLEPSEPQPSQDEVQKVSKGSAGIDDSLSLPTVNELVALAKQSGIKCFHDEIGRSFVQIGVASPEAHYETWAISPKCKPIIAWLRSLAEEEFGVFLPKKLITAVLEVLDHDADVGQMIKLGNRLAHEDGKIFIDLVDTKWQAIEVRPDGWGVTRPDRPLFWRNRHQLSLPEPVGGGSVERLFDFIPVRDGKEQLLIIAWLLAALNPTIIKPMLMQRGQPGSAKTTRTRFLRSLIDPSCTSVLGELERKDLSQVLFHHAVPCFDNLGRFTREEADFFCRAVTGVGVERRKLYTDMDQIVLFFRRPIILNALEVPTSRPDFLDRCLVLNAERIPGFRSEEQLSREFENQKPLLLGALLDLLVRALTLLPTTKPSDEFRMVDFVRHGRAVARAMGREALDFDLAYRDAQREHVDDAMENDPLARAVITHLEAENLEGSAEQILKALTAYAKRNKIAVNTKEWPKSGRWFSTRINELAPTLATKGIYIARMPRTGNSRGMRIHRRATS